MFALLTKKYEPQSHGVFPSHWAQHFGNEVVNKKELFSAEKRKSPNLQFYWFVFYYKVLNFSSK